MSDAREIAQQIWDEICNETASGGDKRSADIIEAALLAEREKVREQVWRAHVPVTNEQHDPANGLISGFCERCRTPWPCEYSPEKCLVQKEQAEVIVQELWRNGLLNDPSDRQAERASELIVAAIRKESDE